MALDDQVVITFCLANHKGKLCLLQNVAIPEDGGPPQASIIYPEDMKRVPANEVGYISKKLFEQYKANELKEKHDELPKFDWEQVLKELNL